MKEKKWICFVITPIGKDESDIRGEIDVIYDEAINPALNEKFEVKVAHKNPEIDSINDRIIKQIYDAKLIVANLTNLNPNVMYELGIAHALCKPVIMIAKKGTELSFDIICQNTIFYTNGPSGILELKKAIELLESTIDYSKAGYGQVYSVLKSYKIEEKLLNQSIDLKNELITYWNENMKRLETKIDILRIGGQGVNIDNSNDEFGWKKDKLGWHFVEKNGEWVKEQWRKDGSYMFYLDKDGYIATDKLIEDMSNFYYVDEDGKMVVDRIYATKQGLMYFDNKGRAFMNGTKNIEGVNYNFKNGILMLK